MAQIHGRQSPAEAGFPDCAIHSWYVSAVRELPVSWYVNSRGLAWTVKCLGKNAIVQLHSDRLKSINSPWQRFEWQFDIPRTNCEAQELLLALAARDGSESIATGTVFFDNIVVRKQQN